jgi:thymidylate kinase
MSDRGKLIAIEGTDEGLLDTLADGLSRWLRDADVPVEQTAAPTLGPAGAQIRLCQQGRLRLDPACLALLFTADRIDHLTREGGIRSWLDQGHHVLCARYWLFSYATLLDHVELDWLRAIDAPCLLPDGTLFIDALPAGPAEDGARLRKNHLRVVEALQGDGHRILHMDGGLPLGEIQHECQRELGDWLNTDDTGQA